MEQHTGQFMEHLPYLRRYARALTGTTGRGDALVTRVLEWYLEAGKAQTLSRSDLYRHLNASQDETGPPPNVAPYHPVESALMSLEEIDRRLYLLVNLEDLPVSEAAAVLGLPPEEAVERLTNARDRVRARLTATILIVEDDAIIAYDLAETVQGMGHNVCGNAATMDEALTLAARHRPTLALMDIRLADGDNGLEVARELRSQRFLPVIFVTAFPNELAKQGLEHLGPVIPKPFTREQIEQAITRAVFTPHPEEASLAMKH